MSKDLISKVTRNEFREALSRFVIREIAVFFENFDFKPDQSFVPTDSSERRTLVDRYYASIDFSDVATVQRVLRVYSEIAYKIRENENMGVVLSKGRYDELRRRMADDGFEFQNGRFEFGASTQQPVSLLKPFELSEANLREHVDKATEKIGDGDFSGAITSAYTLIEEFLKMVLRRTGTKFNENEGDIRTLYKSVSAELNLNPGGENLENHLKTILQGLQSQVSGLYDVANKASDRHARKYNPSKHHAKLAVNASFALCDFLLGSFEHQEQLKKRKSTDGAL